jgi:phenylacetate-CoA ligase
VRLIQDAEYATWRSAVKILYNRWTGCKSGDIKLLLWGSERDIFFEKEKLKVRFGRWLRNEVWFNAFKMTPSDIDECLNTINTFKPVQILAYAESIYELARYIERKDLKVFSPNAIMSTAGTLYPKFRDTIERVLNAPVYNRYGSREVGDIACECNKHRGLHVSIPTHYVEIIKRDGSPTKQGEIGEIVITLLTNFAMPLIRYRIGDMGVWSEELCSCGRNWPLIKEIKGRVTDIFLTNNGDLIDGEFFTHLLYFQDWVKKFQVIQEDYNYIKFIIAPYKKDSNNYLKQLNELAEIKDKVRQVMGEDCKIEFEFVNDIEKPTSGKYRYTISKVPLR